MTTETVPSFIDGVITANAIKKSAFGKASALVEARNEEHFANRIGGAWAALIAERNQFRVLDQAEQAGGLLVRSRRELLLRHPRLY